MRGISLRGPKSLTRKDNKSLVGSNAKSKGKVAKRRLDELLVVRGLADDVVHARALVMAGKVLASEQRQEKAGMLIAEDAALRVKGESRFVSRGGDKLWMAIEDLELAATIAGIVVLDVGASTGGFTDCCLELGAKQVIALDVGTGQLAWELRQDPRVISLEQTDIREFNVGAHADVDLVVADVSFNSLARLAPALRRAAPSASARFLLLVKPQFELPRHVIPKGGVVTDPEAHARALDEVRAALEKVGLAGGRAVPSRLPGRTGNREIFYYVEARAQAAVAE